MKAKSEWEDKMSLRKQLESEGRSRGIKVNKDGTISKDGRFKTSYFETIEFEIRPVKGKRA